MQKALSFYFYDFELPIELMIHLEIHSFREIPLKLAIQLIIGIFIV